MRTFLSQGPIDLQKHFGVPRTELVNQCVNYLVGDSLEGGGKYFTIWAPRQTGKTWIMNQAVEAITRQYGDQVALVKLSFGRLFGSKYHMPDDQDDPYFPKRLARLLQRNLPGEPDVQDWDDFYDLFDRHYGVWDRPLLLLIDEVDTIPAILLDLLVRHFRDLYHARERNWLHGLALIGVRAVLGVESMTGSPFNVQHSIPIPNLTFDEVCGMYQQYQEESGQLIASTVVEDLYAMTQGQPGLVSWFGELLTTTYNPGRDRSLTMSDWHKAYAHATSVEFNTTLLNVIAKARGDYRSYVTDLFTKSDVKFSFVKSWCSFLYMHGIIDYETQQEESGAWSFVCRFASPYIQLCVYNALTEDRFGREECPTFAPGESIDVAIGGELLDLPALLNLYQHYLARLRDLGINPWYGQPRRESDARLTEAVGHFHLYAWILRALPRPCSVSPEFPTGNGKVDLFIRCGEKRGCIEIKSYVDQNRLHTSHQQAAHYAQQLGLDGITLAVFIETHDQAMLAKLSGETTIDGVLVTTVMIGWGG